MATRTSSLPALAAVAAGAPRFLIPSHVWYGLAPRLDGVHRAPAVPELADGGWGGLLSSDEDVGNALVTIDPALLVLNLAGYQVPEVVIGIPAAPAETAATDLISVDMATMEISQGTARAGAVPGTTPPAAHVSLWIEPRYNGAALALEAAPPGWVRLAWSAATSGSEWWGGDLATAVDELTAALIEELVAHRAAALAASGPDSPVLCGLLSLYDPRTWTVPFPSDPPFDRITPGVTLFGERLTELVTPASFEAFLRSEVDVTGPTAAGRWPRGTSDEAKRQAVDELSWCTDELVAQCLDGAVADPDTAGVFAGTAWSDVDALSVTGLLLRWQELGVLDFLAPIEEVAGMGIYGGYDLRRGDNDTTNTWGGAPRTRPAPLARGYVAQLRADLAALGFGPLFTYDDGEATDQQFEVWLERAVREFQLYARMPNLAEESIQGPGLIYGETLTQVPNPAPYSGPVCGVVNGETRTLIQVWLDRRLRSPIVVEARSAASNFTQLLQRAGLKHTDNVWRAAQVDAPAAEARFYARDFTGHWSAAPGVVPADQSLDLFALGQWATTKFGGGPWTSAPTTTWPSAEITPERFVGKAPAAMSAAERSTFRVIRAVSEVECLGYFDCFNAYDSGFISAGPYHWILGKARTNTDPAELPPFFAYLKSLGGDAAQAAYDAFGVFGCGVTKEWNTSGPQSTFFEPVERKYVGWITFEDEHGNAVEAPRTANEGGEWFRQWHWYARFALNARTNHALRTRMWDYARLRVRDVLDTPWEPATEISDGNGGTKTATIGDYFTSERAVGILLRWHVNQPPGIFPKTGFDDSKLTDAFDTAGASGWGDPSTWTDANQETLCDALYELRPSDPDDWLRKSLDDVYEWPASWGSNPYQWQLNLDPLLNYPRIAGLANARTDTGTAYAVAFTVDARDGEARPPTATSSNQAIVADAGVAVTGTGPAYTLTATPLKAGSTTITVTADNGAHTASARFVLTVGGSVQAGNPPAPTLPTLCLSTRHRSFVLDRSAPL